MRRDNSLHVIVIILRDIKNGGLKVGNCQISTKRRIECLVCKGKVASKCIMCLEVARVSGVARVQCEWEGRLGDKAGKAENRL